MDEESQDVNLTSGGYSEEFLDVGITDNGDYPEGVDGEHFAGRRFPRCNRAKRDLYVTEPASQHAALSAVMCEFEQALATEVQKELMPELGEPGLDPAMFTPEPRNIKDMLKLPMELRKPWMRSEKSELKNLVDNGTFAIEDPNSEDKVIGPTMVYKAKINSDGTLDKLKTRIVARGDMMQGVDFGDTWAPMASLRLLRLFCAEAARVGGIIKQLDFIGASLQAKVGNRVFIQLPSIYGTLYPEYSQYCG